MEENILDHNTQSELHLSQSMVDHLYETAKWAKLLSIVGFVVAGIMVLVGLFMGTMMGSLAGEFGEGTPGMGGGLGALMSVIYIGIAAVYVYPMYKLFIFAKKTKQGLDNDSQADLEEGIAGLKSHYKFLGILTAIFVGFYALMLVIGLLSGGAAMLMR